MNNWGNPSLPNRNEKIISDFIQRERLHICKKPFAKINYIKGAKDYEKEQQR